MPSSALPDIRQETRARGGTTRAAIIEAGRAIACREGVGQVSLSMVATETGLSPSAVFGYFRTKDELLVAIVAEDLAAVAGLMRGQPVGSQSTRYEADLPFPVADDVAVMAELGASIESKQLSRLFSNDTASTTFRSGAQGEEANANVDIWLERRLRIFERMLAEVERRLKECEASAARVAAMSEHGARTLFQRMESFERQHAESMQSAMSRVEEIERRQRGVTSEMRAAMNDAATRIEILEAARRAEQEGMTPRHSTELGEAEATHGAPDEPGFEQDSYMAAAWRVADAAATLANLEGGGKQEEDVRWRAFASRRVPLYRRHYFLAASVAVAALAVSAFLAFYLGEVKGRKTATAEPSVAAVSHKKAAEEFRRTADTHELPDDPLRRLMVLAQAGNPRADLLLGLSFLRGQGVPRDQPRAAEWIRKAAEQHQPLAEYWLGALYEHGDGVLADPSMAVSWYEAAAAQGNRKAMHALGVAFAQGIGTQKNYSAAARWFAKAASMGLMNSQFNLGVLYERGLGVPQSLSQAYAWYAIAAAQGDDESRARVEALRTQLSPQEVAKAQQAATMFHAQAIFKDANDVPDLAALEAGSARASTGSR